MGERNVIAVYIFISYVATASALTYALFERDLQFYATVRYVIGSKSFLGERSDEAEPCASACANFAALATEGAIVLARALARTVG